MINTTTKTSQTNELARMARFMSVGALGTILDFGLLTLLKLNGWATLPANSLSFTAGLLNNFTWNRLWTFGDVACASWQRQFPRFVLVSLAGLAFNNLIVLGLEQVISTLTGQDSWAYLPAKVCATGMVVFWNYFANRMWTFKE